MLHCSTEYILAPLCNPALIGHCSKSALHTVHCSPASCWARRSVGSCCPSGHFPSKWCCSEPSCWLIYRSGPSLAGGYGRRVCDLGVFRAAGRSAPRSVPSVRHSSIGTAISAQSLPQRPPITPAQSGTDLQQGRDA